MKSCSILVLLFACGALFAANEEPIDSRFRAASADPLIGDWQGAGLVAQVFAPEPGHYQVNLLRAFDEPDARAVAVLTGAPSELRGDDWTGSLTPGVLRATHAGKTTEFKPVSRPLPTLGLKAPAGAVVLFDGRGLDAWANKKGKQWLVEDGPAPWRIVDGVLEVVPGTGGGIITHRQFGDCRLHLEFRTLGAPSNSGVFLQTRYEVNINETYGRLDGVPNGGLDNCTPPGTAPKIRAARPPLTWQTLDIDFTAPRFDAAGAKTADAVATVRLNGVTIYERQRLEKPHGAAGRLGEAPTGPLMLQEHGMPVQFRNVWLIER